MMVKRLIREWLLTFTNKPSLIASKRIERFILFMVAITLTCFYVWHRRNDISPEGLLLIVGPLFVYAGFNTIRIAKDEKETKNNTDTTAGGHVGPGAA